MSSVPPDIPAELTGADLTELHARAGTEAARWKRKFLMFFRSQIALLYLGAITGAASRYGATKQMTLLSLLCFLIVAGLRLYQRFSPTSNRWPAARWVAERAKSLAWCYAVGAGPFTFEGSGEETRRSFEAAMLGILEGWPWGSAQSWSPNQITPAMASLRADTHEARRAAYLRGRIEDQVNWYEAKAKANAVAGRRWDLAFAAISIAAIGGGVLQLAGLMDFDLLRLAGFAAALIVSWTGLNRHGRLAKTYRSTGRELADLAREIPASADESRWSGFVHQIEATIRREEAGWFEARN